MVMIGQKWFSAPVYVEGGWVGNGAHRGACRGGDQLSRSMQPWIRNTPPSYHLHFDLCANYQQPDFGHLLESYLSTGIMLIVLFSYSSVNLLYFCQLLVESIVKHCWRIGAEAVTYNVPSIYLLVVTDSRVLRMV